MKEGVYLFQIEDQTDLLTSQSVVFDDEEPWNGVARVTFQLDNGPDRHVLVVHEGPSHFQFLGSVCMATWIA